MSVIYITNFRSFFHFATDAIVYFLLLLFEALNNASSVFRLRGLAPMRRTVNAVSNYINVHVIPS